MTMEIAPSTHTDRKPNTQRLLMWYISPSMADALFSWANLVLIVGAAAVLIGTIGSIQMASVKEHFADLRISENERATAQANAEASTAQLELTKLKAPRSLTDAQVAEIREKLKAFGRQPFGMITYWNLDEPTKYTQRIGNDALVAAGWQFIKAERFEALIGVVTGIEVQIADDAPDEYKSAAKALTEALAGVDPSTKLRSEPGYKTLIKIQIGMKP